MKRLMYNNVLIISYHYPPDLAVGAIRAAKFAKYLPEYDITPVILTVKEKYYDHLDDKKSIQSSHKGDVYRTWRIPNFRDVYLYFKSQLKKNTSAEKVHINEGAKDASEDVIAQNKETIVERFKRYFNSVIVWLPDDKTGWIIPAVIRGLFLVYSKKIDAIYTTGPPHSVHIIGLLLKVLTGRRWVSDFRDPWIVDDKPLFVRSTLSDKLERWLVKSVVDKSDTVISVTPEMTNWFQQHFLGVAKSKFVTIYNGYDSKEYDKYLTLKKHEKITFTYAGSFYLGRDPEHFLKALRLLIDEQRIQEDKIAVQFIGSCRYLYGNSIEDMVQRIGLEKVVTFTDYIPRHEAFREMARSHIMILFAQNQPLQIPGKLYEYIGLRSVVLAICGPGATANILSDYERAVVVKEDSIDNMKEALLEVVKLAASSSDCDKNSAPPYSGQLERTELARKLADYFVPITATYKVGKVMERR